MKQPLSHPRFRAFAGFLIALIPTVGGCGHQVLAQAQPKAPFAQAKGELSIVAGVTRAAPAKAIFSVRIDRNGAFLRAGKKVSKAALQRELAAFAKLHPSDRKLEGSKLAISSGKVLLRAHPRATYEGFRQLLFLCIKPDVQITDIFVAVRAKKSGAVMAIATPLPIDEVTIPAGDQWVVDLEIGYGLPSPLPGELAPKLRKAAAAKAFNRKPAHPEMALKPESEVPMQALMRTIFACQRAGFSKVTFAQKRPGLARPRGGAATLGFRLHKPRVATSEIEEEEEKFREEPEPRKGPGKVSPGPALDRRVDRRKKFTGRKAKVAVEDGLAWLARHQDTDGRWDCDKFMKHDAARARTDGAGNAVHDVGATGLVLLAFLGSGNTMSYGPHKEVVKRAVVWLQQQQGQNGLFGKKASHDYIYDQAIATYAMCEAYGLSGSRVLRRTAQRAINYLESHRNPYAVWRYQPRDNDNDTSVTSWCLQAYSAAKGYKLRVNPQALKAGIKYLDRVTVLATGRCGYTKRGEKSSRFAGQHSTKFPVESTEPLTAAGLYLRALLGQDPKKTRVMSAAAKTVRERAPDDREPGSVDFYYWFYAAHALHQVGDSASNAWNRKLQRRLMKNQRRKKNFSGSWDPSGVWGQSGGRVYATALAILALEAPYRVARLHKR